jgi:HisJ family histidinol phosphate phosphatase
MTKVNYHIHTTGSDGTLSPRQVIEEAIMAGIKHMCLTDHYNYPKEVVDQTRPKTSNTEEYHQDIIKLKKEFKGKML